MSDSTKKTITVRDVINGVIANLECISVPMNLMESVGLPLAREISNLKEVIKAWDIAEAKQKEDGKDA